ncbi:hypothetical protein WJX73_008358 [Symbiochloris irregularis]|uniref:Protein kinase domain-containing protein n=1 Tax=Symbiochloris irregularis TaxID=706552 RepID=A0AAW1NQG6_9CHLO
MRTPGGGFEYEGGETRLVGITNFCSYRTLVDSLERVTGTVANAWGGSDKSDGQQAAPSLRFQLPSEPNTYVDLVDDEDVQLMFDEWADYTSNGRHSTAKLHIFVDWQHKDARTGRESLSQMQRPSADPIHHDARPGAIVESPTGPHSTGSPVPRAESSQELGSTAGHTGPQAPAEQAGAAAGGQQQAHQQLQQQQQKNSGGSGASAGPRKLDLREISDRLEIINPEDVTLLKFLGAGGYGEVYLGKWHSSEAAIKCLNPSLFAGTDSGHVSHAAILELIREAEILGSLRHPNVVWVYGVVLPHLTEDNEVDPDMLCEDSVDIATSTAMAVQTPRGQRPGAVRPPAIVTEFLSQGSLRGVLSRKSDLLQGPLVRVLIAMDAAKGMEYLHSKKIVHFDLKSANLLLGYRDRRAICKVADFGLSKQKRETYVSGVSSQRGTLPWIAPEIIKTPHAVTEKADVYSFGVVLWELWTGREPYEGLNYHALLHQITTSSAQVRPVMPGTAEWDATGEASPAEPCTGYQDLIERCWGDCPGDRPSFREIVASLRGMASGLRPARRTSTVGLPPGQPAGFLGVPAAAKPPSEPSSPHHNH